MRGVHFEFTKEKEERVWSRDKIRFILDKNFQNFDTATIDDKITTINHEPENMREIGQLVLGEIL